MWAFDSFFGYLVRLKHTAFNPGANMIANYRVSLLFGMLPHRLRASIGANFDPERGAPASVRRIFELFKEPELEPELLSFSSKAEVGFTPDNKSARIFQFLRSAVRPHGDQVKRLVKAQNAGTCPDEIVVWTKASIGRPTCIVHAIKTSFIFSCCTGSVARDAQDRRSSWLEVTGGSARKFGVLYFFLTIGGEHFVCGDFFKSRLHPVICEHVLDIRFPELKLLPVKFIGRCVAVFRVSIDGAQVAEHERGVAFCSSRYF